MSEKTLGEDLRERGVSDHVIQQLVDYGVHNVYELAFFDEDDFQQLALKRFQERQLKEIQRQVQPEESEKTTKGGTSTMTNQENATKNFQVETIHTLNMSEKTPEPEDETTFLDCAERQILERLKFHLEDVSRNIAHICKEYARLDKVTVDPHTWDQLFKIMEEKNRLKPKDVVFLQILLWKVEENGLFQLITGKADEWVRKFGLEIVFLRTNPDAKGQEKVKFHLCVMKVDFTEDKQRTWKSRIAILLWIDVDQIEIESVEFGGSAWVTVTMPAVLSEALQKKCQDPFFQNDLNTLLVDRISCMTSSGEQTMHISATIDTLHHEKCEHSAELNQEKGEKAGSHQYQRHTSRQRRPVTQNEIYEDAINILDKLLTQDIEQRQRSASKTVRQKEAKTKVLEKVSHGGHVGGYVAGDHAFSQRAQTVPESVYKPDRRRSEDRQMMTLNHPEDKLQTENVEDVVSSADTEASEDEDDNPREKKSLFKRAKERLRYTFQRDQMQKEEDYEPQEKSDTKSTRQKPGSKAQKEDKKKQSNMNSPKKTSSGQSVESGVVTTSLPTTTESNTSGQPRRKSFLKSVRHSVSRSEKDTLPELPFAERMDKEKEAMYQSIADKLREMADRLPISASEGEDDPNPGQPELSELEQELIMVMRTRGDRLATSMDDSTDGMTSYVKEQVYSRFSSTLRHAIGDEVGWNQLAMFFHITKSAFSAADTTSRVLSQGKEMVMRYFSDRFAGWIVQQGGWENMLSESDSELD